MVDLEPQDPLADSGQAPLGEPAGTATTDVPIIVSHQGEVEKLMEELGQDPYDEDQAELHFLHSKPTCFIVIGKPGSGKTTLARHLAQEWKCEIVSASDLIMQAVELETELGIKAKEILLRGEAISEDMAVKFLEEKVNSVEVAHHGYILDGFPSLCEDHMTIKDQLELIKNFKLKPDFIINLKLPDKDLESRRIGQRVDPISGEMYIKEVYAPEKSPLMMTEGLEEGGEEEEEEEEEDETGEEEADFNELPPEVVERLLHRPEDLPQHVEENIRIYKNNMLRMLEDYMADHDQQYLIELDANQPAHILFKQLMNKLSCFVLRPAATVNRLQDPEEEDMPEEVETDELMRSLASKMMVAPRYRWRRSRWLRNCPVALYEGNVIPGKPEFAVSFLDKTYVLSSPEAVEKFLKNPRPYMMPPQPRPPCKICVTGPHLSGKTAIAHLLAQKYGAKVLDIDELMKPKLEAEKQKIIEQAKAEATEQAIVTIKAKLKEEQEAALLKEEMSATEAEETAAETEAEQGEDGENKDDAEKVEDGEKKEDSEGKPEAEEEKGPPPIEVDETHPEVVAIVDAAVAEAEKQELNLPVDAYIEVMEEATREVEKEMRLGNPDGPLNGGWVLDNFPRTREQWAVLIEKGIVIDEVVCLRDPTENGTFLMKRWYRINRAEIDSVVKVRADAAAAEKAKKEEEQRLREEEEKRAEEEAKKAVEEEERKQRIEAGEDLSEVTEEEEESEKPEGESEVAEGESEVAEGEVEVAEGEVEGEPAEKAPTPTPGSSTVSVTIEEVEAVEPPVPEPVEEQRPPTPEEDLVPPDCPEIDAQKQKRKDWENEWPGIQAVITGSTSVEPLQIEVEGKTEDEIIKEAVQQVERPFAYQGWEQTGIDIDEEEEDADADDEEEEEDEGEEEEDPNRSKKKPLGDFNHFCPVALKESGVLFPGNPEVAARFREKTYYFSTNEARDKFLAAPTDYMSPGKPATAPPIRLLILGARGSGKSLHGRHLAKKLAIFHISFKERLQELIMQKTKGKKIGPEYEEDQEEPDEPEEADEEDDIEIAITAPDGTEFKPEEEAPPAVSESKELAEEAQEEEEAEPELTEDEENIKANLESDEALPNETLDNIVPGWWNTEPFKSTGFILEGFPRTPEEARYLAEAGLFPDTALMLSVEDTDVIARLLPPKMDKWKAKRDKRLAKKQRAKDKVKKKRDALIAKRRDELLKELAEKKAEKAAQKAEERGSEESGSEEEVEEEEEEEEEMDIEGILAEEFEEEEEEEEEDEELEEDAHDRIKNDMEEVYDNDTNKLAACQDTLEEVMIPRIELDGGRKPHIVRYALTKKLKPYIHHRDSLFERVYPIGEKLAIRMLQLGYKQPSRFGRWDPVLLSDGDCIQPMNGPGYSSFPAIYRQHIYFMSTSQNREFFCQDPLTYLKQPSPKPVVPIRMSIIGPPKSGKTALANRFAEQYGCSRLSIGEAIRNILMFQPKTELATLINSHIQRGLTVPDELAIQALDVALLDMKCQTRGYILDGFPVTKKQVDLMEERHMIPTKIVELNVDSKELMIRGTKDRLAESRALPFHDSAKILAIRLACWQKDVGEVREWYTKEHKNYKLVDGERSKWHVWNSALDEASESIQKIQTYLERVADGKAASIFGLCITPSECKIRLGSFGEYCPVSLALRGELVDCSVTDSLENAAEFRSYYYKMAGPEELELFLAEPEKYVPPVAPRELPSPELLPRRVPKEEVGQSYPDKMELLGYCAVTYLDGKLRYEAIVPGSPEFVAEYRDKFYSMECEEKLQKFLRRPDKYSDLKLPHKLPPKKQPLPIVSLPMLGYMEQSVATAITKALTAVGCFKPKYPFISASRSAQLYVAYHLKAFNPKSSDYVRKKYKQKLDKFEETCRLINYLGDKMTVKYTDPDLRPSEFDMKLQEFLALKTITPTTNWIA